VRSGARFVVLAFKRELDLLSAGPGRDQSQFLVVYTRPRRAPRVTRRCSCCPVIGGSASLPGFL